MRWPSLYATLPLLTLAALLSSCGLNKDTAGINPRNHPSGTGPFDKNGNYVEAWADTPSKWGRNKPVSEPAETSPVQIAKNEQPPENAVPLAPGGTMPVIATNTHRERSTTEIPSRPKTREVEVSARPKTREVEIASSTKSAGSRSAATTKARTEGSSSARSKTETASNKPKAKSSSSKTVASAKSKTKAPSRYTIKKGDNLSLIAKRYNTSVAAIQKANGLKGNTIQTGKALVIPRY